MRTTQRSGTRTSDMVAQARVLRSLFDRLATPIASWDQDLRHIGANRAYLRWTGLTRQELKQMSYPEVVGAEDFAEHRHYIQGALNGVEQSYTRTLRDRSGELRHVEISFLPAPGDGTDGAGFHLLLNDVTRRVVAEQAQAEAERLAEMGSWSYDPDTGLLTWSDQLYRIFGRDPATFETSNAAVRQLIHPEDLPALDAAADAAVATGRDYAVDHRILLPDGTVREVRTHGQARLLHDGTLVRITGSVRDLTAINEATREMARVNAELRQVNQLNADVIGMLGHDVRQPLSVVLGYLEELVGSWSDIPDQERRSYAETVLQAATRMRGLVDDIVAMASLDSGGIAARPDRIDLATELREVLSSTSGGGRVVVETHTGRPVLADPFHTRQILANLISNALAYGAPPFVITIDEVADHCEVTVCDHGDGVPPEFAPHLFERFSRPTSGRTVRGSGFGLYLVRALAKANGGDVDYRPHQPHGSCFTLQLPLA